jgi:hypothetical protein
VSSFTLRSPAFPSGTSVGAYRATNWPAHLVPPRGAPQGSPDGSAAVASDGSLTLSGLAIGVDYYAYALVGGEHRYVKFRIDAATIPTRSPSIAIDPTLPPYNAKGDAVALQDGAITSGQATLTCATGAFKQSDVGKRINVIGAGAAGACLTTTILTFTDATHVVLAANAGTTVSGAGVVYGTDDGEALQAALDAAGGAWGAAVDACSIVWLTRGFMCARQLNQPNGVRVDGPKVDFGTPMTLMPNQGGAIFCCATGLTALLSMGATGGASAPGTCRPELGRVTVDGCDLPTHAVQTKSRRCRLEGSQVWRGVSTAIRMDGQNTEVIDCIAGQNLKGYCLTYNAADCKVYGGQSREGGTAQILMNGGALGGGYELSNHHSYGGLGQDLEIRCFSGNHAPVKIVGNMFDDTGVVTPASRIVIKHNGASSTAGIHIVGNTFYTLNAITNDLIAVIEVQGTGGFELRGLNVTGNTYKHFINGTTGYVRALVELTGGGSMPGCVVTGNAMQNCIDVARGFIPAVNTDNVIADAATSWKQSTAMGQSVQNGTGAQTVFTIPHGVKAHPSRSPIAIVTAGAAGGRGDFHVTCDGTNITVTYATAPASGTGNVVLNWLVQS